MEKPVVFKNKNGKQLVGILHIPKGKSRFPVVIICHGFGGTKTRRKFVRLARALEKKKIATFRFDFEGCGDSEGNFETITVKRQISDLKSAISWISKQKIINKNKIALLGHSLGSVITALFVAQNKFPVRTLVFWAPAFNQKRLFRLWNTQKEVKKWKRQGYILWKEFKVGKNYLKENKNKDYSLILYQLKNPILIIHGKKDETVPLKFSKELIKNYKNIKLLILPKAEHKFEDYYIQKKLIKETASWLRNKLWIKWG